MPGDLLFFRGDDELSRAIAFKTSTWSQWAFGLTFSHVGICAEVTIHGERPAVWLFESTTLCISPCLFAGERVSGVQAHWPQDRVDEYRGKVWRLRLTDPLDADESGKLSKFLADEIGKPYDAERAVLLAGRRMLFDAPTLAPTPNARFCSELAAEASRRADRIVPRGVDPESYSPNSLALAALHSGEVWPVGGRSQSRRVK